jgi:hypothetical protein
LLLFCKIIFLWSFLNAQDRRRSLLFAVDLAGTLLFAIEGGSAAASGQLDLLGVMVLAFATAVGGGIIRDLLIGAVPPASLRDWRYAALAFFGGFLVFFLHRYVNGIPLVVVLVLDAAGLSLFAIAGTEKASFTKCLRSWPFFSGPLPRLAVVCFAIFSLRAFHDYCNRIFTPPLQSLVPL